MGSISAFFLLWSVLGLVSLENPLTGFSAVIIFAILLVLMAAQPVLKPRVEQIARALKPLIIISLIPLCFYLLESPYGNPFSLAPEYLLLNLGIVAIFFTVAFFIGQRKNAVLILILLGFFVVGIANYFVILFKGQPVLPSDLFALSTAASVSAGYTYTIDDSVVSSLIALSCGITAVFYLPDTKATPNRFFANSAISLSIVLLFCSWFLDNDLEDAYGCKVDVWNTQQSYAENGSSLCFLKRAQDLVPEAPTHYATGRMQQTTATYGATDGEIAAFEESEEKPSVIVIMNETFSDLSLYEALSGTYDGIPALENLSGTLMSGNAYVSALGGGTCNSEFEFLTGSSIGNMGGGVYPYMLYDFSSTDNIAAHLKQFGYQTTAIHPAEAGNWRRNQVYAQLGFDQFYDIESYRDAPTLRNLVTDAATYDTALSLIESSEDPQFIFDVTIQNHGGYDSGLIPEDLMVDLGDSEYSSLELAEYLSCMDQSLSDLGYLLERLEALDKKVVLCFFGDHQPSIVTSYAEASVGKPVNEFNWLDEVQLRYTVPYFVWSNYETGSFSYKNDPEKLASFGRELYAEDWDEASFLATYTSEAVTSTAVKTYSKTTDLSLNYLSAYTLANAGIPLSPYQDLVLDTHNYLPALNLNGYLGSDGTWYWYDQESASTLALRRYEVAQYANLFD